MRKTFYAAALSLTAAAAPAHGCISLLGLDVSDVRYADVVVVGRITNYGVVAFRQGRSEGEGYARLEIIVDEVLKGQAPHTVSATWDDPSFAEPKVMPTGPHLIALHSPKDRRFGPATFTIAQTSCSPAFILDTTSQEADAARKLLNSPR